MYRIQLPGEQTNETLKPALLDDSKTRDGDACGASWNISNTFTDASGSYLEEYIQHKS